MAGSIAAYGNVLPGKMPRGFHVEVFKPAKLPALKKQLADWEGFGFLRWRDGLPLS